MIIDNPLIRVLITGIVIAWGVLHSTFIAFQYEDIYKQVEKAYPLVQNLLMANTNYSKWKEKYNESTLNFIEEPSYCLESDLLKYMHPKLILEDQYILRDLDRNNLQREIIKKRAFDAYQSIKIEKSNNQEFNIQYFQILVQNTNIDYQSKYHIFTRINPIQSHIINLEKVNLYEQNNKIIQGLGCLFQKFNHVPGMYSITSKNSLMNSFLKYQEQIKNKKKPQYCIGNSSYLPETLRLNVKSECETFFENLKQVDYQKEYREKGPEFILKTDQHRGEGIILLFPNQIKNLTDEYEWGAQCGNINTKQIVQKYIRNPFLYKNHKIEFRIYIYIASTSPLMVYSYKRALIKRCAGIFNVTSEDIPSHICNTAIVEKNRGKDDDDSNEQQNEEENEEYFIDWDLDGIEKLLIEQGRLQVGQDWLNKYLYPKIWSKLIHMIRSGQSSFYKDSRFSEFLAVDFLLDDDLDIWILEVNFNPQILSVTPDRIKRNYKMITDTLEISFSLLRGRYMRIKRFIEKILMPDIQGGKKYKQAEFDKKFEHFMESLLKDRIESQYPLSNTNGFVKIIDESFEEEEVYMGIVNKECL